MIVRILSLSLALLAITQAQWLTAPVPDSPPVNQLRAHGNACGPACLLDAMRSGSKKWQLSIAKVTSETDTKSIIKILNQFGKGPSKLNPKRARWNPRNGISAIDLVSMANEMRTESWMGTVSQEIFLATQSDPKLLRKAHRAFSKSIRKGLPPILIVRRMAHRPPSAGAPKIWLTVERHYLVLTSFPQKLPRNAHQFEVTYHDPWGGKECRGTIKVTPGHGFLTTQFPQTKVGLKRVRKGEASLLSLSSALGLF